MRSVTLTPAYGRDYKNKQSVLDDWHAHKDFIINDVVHPYCGRPANKLDLSESLDQVMIRYGKLRKMLVIDLTE